MPQLDSVILTQGSDLEVNPALSETFLGSYSYARDRIVRLLQSWHAEFEATEYRRRCRNISVNVQDLRAKGRLKPDETIIPIRTIDTNIRRSQPPKIAFLKQSRRLAVFKPIKPELITTDQVERLEKEFTRVCQYEGWEFDYFDLIDGGDCHGWDSVEICYDDSKPAKVCIKHNGHDKLIFSLDARDIQSCELVLKIHYPSVSKLRDFVRIYGFNEQQVNYVIQSLDSSTTESARTYNESPPIEDSAREIFKVWFKYQGQVYIAWFAKCCTDWLLEPKPLYLGKKEQTFVDEVEPTSGATIQRPQIIDKYETRYPLRFYFNDRTEEDKIRDKKGEAFRSEYKQEASIALWSSFINGCLRACNIHAAPRNQSTGTSPKQTETIIEHGKLWSEPIDFFNTPWPDPMILSGLQALDIQNTQETGQVSFAVKNRKDSRKTAAEIQDARVDQNLLSGVDVSLFSVCVRGICMDLWEIIQSLALRDVIPFLQTASGFDPLTQQPEYANDKMIIDQIYDIFAAGDTDVVERQEKLSRQMQFWPLVQTTPLASEFILDLLKNAFPDESAKYETIIRQSQTTDKQLIGKLANLMQSMFIDQETGGIKPEFKDIAPQLQQLAQETQISLSSSI